MIDWEKWKWEVLSVMKETPKTNTECIEKLEHLYEKALQFDAALDTFRFSVNEDFNLDLVQFLGTINQLIREGKLRGLMSVNPQLQEAMVGSVKFLKKQGLENLTIKELHELLDYEKVGKV